MSGTKISALPAAAALSGTEPVPVVQAGATVKTTTAAIAGLASSPTGANPTATAGPTAVNGAAGTFMRSDASPAVQKASNAQFGIVEGDGTTVTIAAGIASIVGNPLPVTSIQFGAGTVLNDYEEGTWTPTDQSGGGLTFTNTRCTYTKIGRQVFLQINFTYPTTADGHNSLIGGLPFSMPTGVIVWQSTWTATSQQFIFAPGGTSTIGVYTTNAVHLANSTISGFVIAADATYPNT